MKGLINMATAIKISEELITKARVYSKVNRRSITAQIEFWAKIGRCAEENPDMTYDQIKSILIGIEELNNNQGTEYIFG